MTCAVSGLRAISEREKHKQQDNSDGSDAGPFPFEMHAVFQSTKSLQTAGGHVNSGLELLALRLPSGPSAIRQMGGEGMFFVDVF